MDISTIHNKPISYFCSSTHNDVVNLNPLNDKKIANSIQDIYVFVTKSLESQVDSFKKQALSLCSNVNIHEIYLNCDPDDILMESGMFDKLISLYKESFEKANNDFIFNATGGSKQNLLIALEALNSISGNSKNNLFFTPVEKNIMHFPYSGKHIPFEPTGSISALLKQAGYTVKNEKEVVKKSDDIDPRYYQASTDILARNTIMNASKKSNTSEYNLLADVYNTIKNASIGKKVTLKGISNEKKFKARKDLFSILAKNNILTVDNILNPKVITVNSLEDRNFINGGWYECALYQKLTKNLKSLGINDYQLWMNVKVVHNDYQENNKAGLQEFDLLLVHNSKIYIIEAKTGKVDIEEVSIKVKIIQDKFKNKRVFSVVFVYPPKIKTSTQDENLREKGVLPFYNIINEPLNYKNVVQEIISTETNSL